MTTEWFRSQITSSDSRPISTLNLVEYGAETDSIEFKSGSVTMDARRNIERDLSFTAIDPDGELAETLRTPRIEIAAKRGFGDELIGLGIFGIVDVDDSRPDHLITVTCNDRAMWVARNKFLDAFQPNEEAMLTAEVIAEILADRYPDVLMDFAYDGVSVAADLVFGAGDATNPWDDLCELASASSLRLVFDGDGIARLRRITDVRTDQPAVTYEQGSYGVEKTSSERYTSDSVYNEVVATIEGSGVTDEPIRVVVGDDDPQSPTYRGGRMGPVRKFWSTNALTTEEDLTKAALTLLARGIGRATQKSWTMLVDPERIPGEVVETIDLEGTSNRYVIERMVIPLDAESSMTVTAREGGLITDATPTT